MATGYILCATPRSGSTLLCGLLAQAGAGDPHSYFRAEDIAEWAEHWGVPPRDQAGPGAFGQAYLEAAIAAGRGGTPVFGLRLMHESLAGLIRVLDGRDPGQPHDRARLERAFGPLVFVHLTRGDRLAQAVSLIKARQTGLWHIAPDGTELERTAPPVAPRFDADEIARTAQALAAADRGWEAWFAAEGIAPLRLRYEDLAADPLAALARVCAALGRDVPAGVTPGVARLADAGTQDWLARMRAAGG